jgi:hypothetical protein
MISPIVVGASIQYRCKVRTLFLKDKENLLKKKRMVKNGLK